MMTILSCLGPSFMAGAWWLVVALVVGIIVVWIFDEMERRG